MTKKPKTARPKKLYRYVLDATLTERTTIAVEASSPTEAIRKFDAGDWTDRYAGNLISWAAQTLPTRQSWVVGSEEPV